jgi:hypothetical protein
MRRAPLTTVTLATVALLLTACGGGAEQPAPGPTLGEDDLEDRDAVDGSDALVGEEVEAAIREVAQSEGVDESDVEVLITELVTWSDGSLGCPQPDEMYTQALIEGYRIVLGVDGREIAYHGELGQDPFRCDDPQPPAA